MADVTGPISTLAGTHHVVPAGMTCDVHPERPATKRVQGETDSMGCEMNDMCSECYDEYSKAQQEADTSGTCEWCQTEVEKLVDARDYEEGLHGRVYRVCQPCKTGQRNALEATAFDHMSDFDDFDEMYDD